MHLTNRYSVLDNWKSRFTPFLSNVRKLIGQGLHVGNVILNVYCLKLSDLVAISILWICVTLYCEVNLELKPN